MKRFLSYILIALLTLGLLGGCASSENELSQVSGGSGGNINADLNDEFNEIMNEGEEPTDSQTPADTQKPTDSQTPADTQKPSDSQKPSEDTEKAPLPSGPTSPDEADYQGEGWIKVCSYNVKTLQFDHINMANGGPMSKLETVCAEIKKIDADIVGLQELFRYVPEVGKNVDQTETLARMTGYPYYYFCKTVSRSGGGDYGHGFLSRFPIKKTETFAFKDYSIDAAEPRGFSRCELKVDGKTLVFYNTHLAGHQREQMQMITKMMKGDKNKGNYAVLTGDMNAWPSHLNGYVNGSCLMLNSLANPLNTTYRETLTHEKINPIDNIIITNNLEYYWDAYLKNGIITIETSASDHLPIYSYIKMK